MAKAQVKRPGPVLTGPRCPCVRVGQGFGGFLGLCEKVFFYHNNAQGVVLPPVGRVYKKFRFKLDYVKMKMVRRDIARVSKSA